MLVSTVVSTATRALCLKLQRHPSSLSCLVSLHLAVPCMLRFSSLSREEDPALTVSGPGSAGWRRDNAARGSYWPGLSRSCRGALLFADSRSRHKEDRSAASWATCRGDAVRALRDSGRSQKRDWASDGSKGERREVRKCPQPTGLYVKGARALGEGLKPSRSPQRFGWSGWFGNSQAQKQS
ncbi:hypothetical protein M440DRAFT_217968 [Trichoderma longibrachiatum ATCC 18648]|uniref:Uncharacterized protein n=1 Tax=Trichoderma longibrachiatum ATCC 18648 TaxID=983965 RepID=A0A2T4BQ18_TRILO|nr:hypothetical protein M440DRAFT_217968 [Trichoderma longibrachiatum ATCC 18648]